MSIATSNGIHQEETMTKAKGEKPGAPAPKTDPTVSDEDRRSIEDAFAELAAAVREDSPGREPLVGYYLRKAVWAAFNDHGMTDPEEWAWPDGDERHERRRAATSKAFDTVSDRLDIEEDDRGRPYDEASRGAGIRRIAEETIARLEARPGADPKARRRRGESIIPADDRAAIESALSELADAVRERQRDGPGALFGFLARMAFSYSVENNAIGHTAPYEDALPVAQDCRLAAAFDAAWSNTDSPFNYTTRQDREVWRLVMGRIAELERGFTT